MGLKYASSDAEAVGRCCGSDGNDAWGVVLPPQQYLRVSRSQLWEGEPTLTAR